MSEQNDVIGGKTALIALGGNVTSTFGPPEMTLREALSRLSNESLKLSQTSRFFETPAFPAGSGPDFVNAVARVETVLSPDALLKLMHEVEADLGRSRRTRWEARIIDLDLIGYGDEVRPNIGVWSKWRDLALEDQQVLAPDGLVLPHPRLQDRAFVLGPLCDVAPDWVHPVLKQSAAELFAALPEKDRADLRPLSG